MLKDLISNIKTVFQWGGSKTASHEPTTGQDLKGIRSAVFACSIGAVTNIANSPQPSWTFALEESDDNSTFADVAEADVLLDYGRNDGAIASGIFATINAAAEDDLTYTIGYIGTKRYVRVVATAANTPGATPIVVNAIMEAMINPVDDE